MKLTWQGVLTLHRASGDESSRFTWKAMEEAEADAAAERWIEQFLAKRGVQGVSIAATGVGQSTTIKTTSILTRTRYK